MQGAYDSLEATAHGGKPPCTDASKGTTTQRAANSLFAVKRTQITHGMTGAGFIPLPRHRKLPSVKGALSGEGTPVRKRAGASGTWTGPG